MRARDDATRVMRGMGRSFGHLAREQERLSQTSKAAQDRYTSAVKSSTEAQRAATSVVKQQSREATKAINDNYREQNALARDNARVLAQTRAEDNRRAVAGIRETSRLRVDALKSERDEGIQAARQLTNESVRERTRAHDNFINQLKTQRDQSVRGLQDQIARHRQLNQQYSVRNAQIAHMRTMGQFASKEAAHNARQELSQNRLLQAQHQQRIQQLGREVEAHQRIYADRSRAATAGHREAIRQDRAAGEALIQAQRQRFNQMNAAEQGNMRMRLENQAQMYRTLRNQDTQNLNTRLAANQATQQRLLGMEQTGAQRRIAAINTAHQQFVRGQAVQRDAVQATAKDMQAYNQRIQQTQGLLAGVGQSAIIAGGVIGMVGAKITRSFFSAADATAEFSNQNRVAVSVAKDFQGSVQDLGDAVLKVAREVPVPIEDLQETFYYTFSALDVDLKNATELVRGFADEAVVGNAKITDAARSSIAMINAYQMDVSSAAGTTETLTRIQDMQFNTVKWGALTYQDLSTNIGKVIPAATRAGQEIEQIGGMLAFLTRQGLSAEMAATSAARALELISEARVVSRLERMGVQIRDSVTGEMRQLNDIVVDFGRHLEGLDPAGIDNVMQALAPLDGDESQKYQSMLREADRVTERLSGPERTAALHQIFMGAGNRIQARRFWDLALKNYEELDRLVNEITTGHGEFSKTLALAWEEPAVTLGIYNNRLEALKLTIGQEVLPIKLLLVGAITNLIDKWEALDSETKANIVSFALWGGIAATAGGAAALIVGILALITSGMMGIATAALPAQAGILKTVLVAAGMGVGIPLAIGAVVAALVLMIIHWDKVSEAVTNFGRAAMEWLPTIVAVVMSLVALNYTAVAAGFAAIAASIKAAAVALGTFVVLNPALLAIIVTVGAYIAISRTLTASQRALEEATQSYTDNLYNNRAAIQQNIDAIDELNRTQLVNNLETAGMAEHAETLGLSLATVTKAMLGEEDALARVNSALDNQNASVGFAWTERGRLVAASRELEAALKREPAAMAQGTDAFVERMRALGGVEKAIGDLVAMQQRGGPKDVADAVIIARSKEIISASEGVHGILGQLPDDMQDITQEAFKMAGGIETAEDAFDNLSPSAELLKSVLEDINDVEAAFGMSMGRIEESLRATHEQALESGAITEEAFNDMFQEATKNADLVAGAWIDILREQETAHNDYMTNMQIIIARGASHVIDIINDMGEDAPAAMHVMANASAEEFAELERMLTASAERTSDETVAQMDALKEGMTDAISTGISTALFDFTQGMKLMETIAGRGGKATADEISRELGIGLAEVSRLSQQFNIELQGGINPILKALGKSPIQAAFSRLSGGILTGNVLLQKGGKLPGYGGGDIIPAMLEPGELVVRKEIARKLDPHTLHELDIPGFQTGGFVSTGDVPKVPSGFGNWGHVGRVGSETANHVRENVIEWLEENLAPQLGAGIGYKAMMAALHTRFPGLPLYSGFRPGAITATGNPSYHGMGRAVDIPPRMDVNKWIADNYFAQTKELILSLSGATQIRNGRPHFYTGITRAMHFDHNHWAMAQGGIVTQPTNALIGEAGPEAVIPLDRLVSLIQQAMIGVDAPGGGTASVTDQYQRMIAAIDALQAKVDADTRLALARDEVGRIREELSQLGNEFNRASQALTDARHEGRTIAKQQGELARRLGVSADEWRRAMVAGRVITLEVEASIIRQMQTVTQIRRDLDDMRSGPSAQQQLSVLQAQQRVMEQQRRLSELNNPQADQQAVENALKNIEQATARLAEAQAQLNTSIATVAQAQAELGGAQAELARVEQIIPHIDDEVAKLLMRYEAQARVADAQKVLAEANEELVKTENQVGDAQQGLADANRSLAEARNVNKASADELRMAELELTIAQEQLKIATDALTVSADDLRLKEIELALAEEHLQELRDNAFQFLPEYTSAQERLDEVIRLMTESEMSLEEAIEAVTQAERASMEATVGLTNASAALYGLSPVALEYFRTVGRESGVATDAIERQIAAIKELNTISGTGQSAVTMAQDAYNRGKPGSGRDLAIIQSGNIDAISRRIVEIFNNRNVPLSMNLDGSSTDPNARLQRLVREVLEGHKTFEAIRASADRVKAAHNLALGGVVKARRGGTLARIGEGRRDEAVIPLPSNWEQGSIGTEVNISISSGAVQVTVQGSVGDGGEEAIREEVERGMRELIEELGRDWRSR